MVFAEIPLWVVHSGDSSSGGTGSSSNNNDTTDPLLSSFATTTTTTSITNPTGIASTTTRTAAVMKAQNAIDSYYLSSTTGTGTTSTKTCNNNNKKRKTAAAIYSIDCCDSKNIFVTGGGDGTIRIWNMNALFTTTLITTNTNTTNNNNNKEEQEEEEEEEKVNEETKKPTTTTSTKTTKKTNTTTNRMAHYDTTTGAYISSESSSSHYTDNDSSSSNNNNNNDNDDDDDDDNTDPPPPSMMKKKKETDTTTALLPLSSSSSSPPNIMTKEIHDLNAQVRSKKKNYNITNNNNIVSSPQPPPSTTTTTTTTTTTATVSNLSQQQQQHPSSSLIESSTTSSSSRLLCTVAAHTGSSILCVRFSYTGHYIASAGDDGNVCIYTQQQQQQQLSNNHNNNTLTVVQQQQQQQQQQWIRIKLCRGHDLDVVDLAWSPFNNNNNDSSYLVSCSLDSNTPIIVWKLNDLSYHNNNNNTSSSTNRNSSMICYPYKILGKNIHTSTVKGIAFDPIGSYLASSGDDPAICIWRTTHDDWNLITKIDHTSGIFRTWKTTHGDSSTTLNNNNTNDDDIQALSSQSLFRRISWSTDGAFICSTNSVVKNKHVASTISREKWQVSGGGSSSNSSTTTSTTGTAANLVGHKQPIVVSRHASYLLHTKKKKKKLSGDDHDDNDNDGNMDISDDHDDNTTTTTTTVPEYATLLALGDRRGFVTVWSTRKSRPIFKVQCSDSHCTVTDLAWGRQSSSSSSVSKNNNNADMILLVTLLDGQMVAFKFAVPDELGYVLTSKEKARVFQMRYGIDIDDEEENATNMGGGFQSGRRSQLHGKSGPNLIENALQMSLEENMKEEDDNNDMAMNNDEDDDDIITPPVTQQQESRTISGKKRIRPVLVQMNTTSGPSKKQQKINSSQPSSKSNPSTSTNNADPLQSAMMAAERVSVAAEKSNTIRKDNNTSGSTFTNLGSNTGAASSSNTVTQQERLQSTVTVHSNNRGIVVQPTLSYSTRRVHTTDLPCTNVRQDPFLGESITRTIIVECINVTKVPPESKGGPIQCIDVTIASNGIITWKDLITGTFCSAVAASSKIFAIGTTDGTIQLYSTSPTVGWSSGTAFRSHPPLILGTSIVSVQLLERKENSDSIAKVTEHIEMLVVSADGMFGIWTIIPNLQLQYKGTIMPILTHMSYATDDRLFPKLARMQITDTGRLLAILSLDCSSTASHDMSSGNPASSQPPLTQSSAGPGGSLQAFVYDKKSELWIRVSDSRFVLSDFYSALPTSDWSKAEGILSKMDDAVRLGALQSSLKAGQRNRFTDRYIVGLYNLADDETSNFITSRSHCEDRLACAVALNSPSEFKHWLRHYVRVLIMKGQSSPLRILADMLLQQNDGQAVIDSNCNSECWWLSHGTKILNEDRLFLIEKCMIPEMFRNRSLQRLTNEISIEVAAIKQAISER